MLRKGFILGILLLAVLFVSVVPALAQFGSPEPVYVDPYRTAEKENGTKTKPYNTTQEGRAVGQANPNGAYLYVRNPDGSWPSNPTYVAPVISGVGGAPLPTITLYLILGIAALIFIVLGLSLQHRSRSLRE
jgi:hypothetical protein